MADDDRLMCKSCGAPLEAGFGATVLTCEYCGSSMTLEGDVANLISKHTMLVNEIGRDQAVDAARQWMDAGILRRKVGESADIQAVELKYVPVWTVPVTVSGHYSGSSYGGYAADSRTMSQSYKKKDAKGFFKGFGKLAAKTIGTVVATELGGHQAGRVTRNVTTAGQQGHQSSSVQRELYQLILARRASDMDLNQYQIPIQRKQVFNLNMIKSDDTEILNGDMLEPEAAEMAKGLAYNKIKSEIEQRMDNVNVLNLNCQTGEGELTHVPIWFVNYIHNGREHVAAVDGITGHVVNGSRPTVSLGLLGKGKAPPPGSAPPPPPPGGAQ